MDASALTLPADFQPDCTTVRNWLKTGSINVFGMPYSGKDTQAVRIAQWLDAEVLGGGEILRSRNDLPEHVRTMMHAGHLIPAEEYLALIEPYLHRPQYVGKPLVYSSVGRLDGEQEVVMKVSQEAGHPVRLVILLEVSEAVARQRWKAEQDTKGEGVRGSRADDHADSLPRRLREFRKRTGPVLDYYKSHGLLHAIDGFGDPEEVEIAIRRLLHEVAESAQVA